MKFIKTEDCLLNLNHVLRFVVIGTECGTSYQPAKLVAVIEDYSENDPEYRPDTGCVWDMYKRYIEIARYKTEEEADEAFERLTNTLKKNKLLIQL